VTIIEILHAILNIAAGDGAQQWLHDEIDKIERKPAGPDPARNWETAAAFDPAPGA
jgi:hypothetical protein